MSRLDGQIAGCSLRRTGGAVWPTQTCLVPFCLCPILVLGDGVGWGVGSCLYGFASDTGRTIASVLPHDAHGYAATTFCSLLVLKEGRPLQPVGDWNISQRVFYFFYFPSQDCMKVVGGASAVSTDAVFEWKKTCGCQATVVFYIHIDVLRCICSYFT